MQQTKPCLVCGKTIIKPQNESQKNWETRRKYCSKNCLGMGHLKLAGEKTRFSKERKYVPPTAIKKGQKLSPKTQFKKGVVPWNKGKTGLMPVPWNKGKRFTQIVGEKHPQWKGGKTPLNVKIRSLPEMELWRQAVFARDSYTCTACLRRAGGARNTPERITLNADHHPKTFAEIVDTFNIKTIEEATKCEILWDTKNGRTLCLGCHRKITKEQKQHHYKRG